MRRIGSILCTLLCAPSLSHAQPIPPEFQANTTTAGSQRSAVMDANEAGDFVVVWNSEQRPFARVYTASTRTFGDEIPLPLWSDAYYHMDVALAPDRSFVIVHDLDVLGGVSRDVIIRRFDTEGNPLGEPVIQHGSDSGLLCMDSEGGFSVVYRRVVQLPTPPWYAYSFHGQRYDASGQHVGALFSLPDVEYAYVTTNRSGTLVASWGGVAQVYDRAGPVFAEPIPVEGNRCVIDEQGGFTAFWTDQDVLRGQRYSPSGERVGSPLSFEGAPRSTLIQPEPNGFIVLGPWADTLLTARRYTPMGQPRSSLIALNVHSGGRKELRDVASTAKGDFIVVWDADGQDGDGYGVFGRIFDASTAVEATSWSEIRGRYR